MPTMSSTSARAMGRRNWPGGRTSPSSGRSARTANGGWPASSASPTPRWNRRLLLRRRTRLEPACDEDREQQPPALEAEAEIDPFRRLARHPGAEDGGVGRIEAGEDRGPDQNRTGEIAGAGADRTLALVERRALGVGDPRPEQTHQIGGKERSEKSASTGTRKYSASLSASSQLGL